MSAEKHLSKNLVRIHIEAKEGVYVHKDDVFKVMESYAREYHVKEMEKALEEAEKKIENLPLSKDSRSYHGATWLLNHLKEDKG